MVIRYLFTFAQLQICYYLGVLAVREVDNETIFKM